MLFNNGYSVLHFPLFGISPDIKRPLSKFTERFRGEIFTKAITHKGDMKKLKKEGR